jgi:hypothetical protein
MAASASRNTIRIILPGESEGEYGLIPQPGLYLNDQELIAPVSYNVGFGQKVAWAFNQNLEGIKNISDSKDFDVMLRGGSETLYKISTEINKLGILTTQTNIPVVDGNPTELCRLEFQAKGRVNLLQVLAIVARCLPMNVRSDFNALLVFKDFAVVPKL